MEERKVEENKEVQEKEEKELFTVISTSEKTFVYTTEEHGFELTVKFKLPTLKERNTSDMLHSKAYNRLLKDEDNLSVQQLLDLAIKRETWSEESNTRLSVIDEEIMAKKELVNNENAKKKKEKFEEELNNLRNEKLRLALRVGSLTSTALENIAETERTIYLLGNCAFVIDEEGNESLLYTTKQDIENERNMKKLESILVDGKSYWAGEGMTDFLHYDD